MDLVTKVPSHPWGGRGGRRLTTPVQHRIAQKLRGLKHAIVSSKRGVSNHVIYRALLHREINAQRGRLQPASTFLVMDQSEIFHYSRPSTPSQGRNDRPSSSSSQAGPVRRERPNNAPRAFSPATTGQNGMQSQAQKAISVVEWGNNAPLDEEELGSVAVVTNAFKQRPLPAKVSRDFLRSRSLES